MTNPQNTSECENSDEGVRHTTVTPLLDLGNWVHGISPCGNFEFNPVGLHRIGLYEITDLFESCDDIEDRVGTDKIQLIKNLLNEHPFLATPLYTLLFIGEK